ncbi:chaperone SurA [Marivita lacus]|uniref:Parvulin-like PPIase n=1 Tax=Marivita lacus TaxID=1323742 RepID=A0ABQ1KNH3_9RHOB|nr:peptidylprolyl isomerase [Marivita lacus]GGC01887.1 chaperone SurA [Marivita lacus]
MQLLTPSIRKLSALALGVTLALGPVSAHAQNLFAPVLRINDSVVTAYELEQRARMLSVLRAPGNPSELAREQLIDDRLRLQAAEEAGIVPSPEEVLDGMTEFASRANLSREEFIQALEADGVSEQTFRDFVRAGLSWRLLVQARFAGRVNLSETEIDRALGASGESSVRVLLSEIIMPAPPEQAEAVLERAERISQTTSEAEFSAQARQFSATESRGAGGRLPWQNLDELPPVLRPLVLALAPGEVTDPLPIPNAVALFQLRGIEETGFVPPTYSAIEYAAYFLPGGRSDATLAQARVLESRVDRCDDLYGIAKGQPNEVLDRQTLPPADIPTDIAFELSKLDPGEVSTALTRSNGQTLMFLMLCGRTAEMNDDVDRDQFALGLRNQRLQSLAESYLQQLRADARIVTQ